MHVPGSENEIANALANLATNALYPYSVELSVMECPSTLSTVVTTINQGAEQSWMTPIERYLKNGAFFENRVEVVKVKAQAARYSLMNEVLYRCSFLGLYLRCLPLGETEQVIEQVHEGVWGTYIHRVYVVSSDRQWHLCASVMYARGSVMSSMCRPRHSTP